MEEPAGPGEWGAGQLERRSRHLWWLENLPIGSVVELDYSLLAVEASVRTNWLDVETGFLTGAVWAMAVESQRWQPQQLSLHLPPGWSVATSLPITPDGWRAANYDELVDSPLALGDLHTLHFDVGGVPHRWVWQGLQRPAPQQSWQEQLPKICAATCALLGAERPVSDDYLFMTRFSANGYGGLEHDDGCALMFSRRELDRSLVSANCCSWQPMNTCISGMCGGSGPWAYARIATARRC